MTYDGVVIRLTDLFLFILNPETNNIMDGINISEHECYKNLADNQIMVVNVEFRDGTLIIDDIDLNEFIYGDRYGRTDIFIYIKDILLFTVNDLNNKKKLKDLIDDGDLNYVAKDCINTSKK